MLKKPCLTPESKVAAIGDGGKSGRAGAGSEPGTPPKRVPIVSIGRPSAQVASAARTIATMRPGNRGASRRSARMIATHASDITTAVGLMVSRADHRVWSFGRKAAGSRVIDSPRKS